MSKYHFGKITAFGAITFCGAQGAHKQSSHAAMNCAEGKMFAYLMAVEPEMCCAHCVKEVQQRFPNAVRNAAANPEAYATKHGFN